MSTLEKAIQYSRNSFANGEFIQRLGSLIEIVTDSKGSVSAQVLREYYTKGLFNIFEELGIKSKIIDNPINDKPPFLIGSRIESPEYKTILLYGHGDTVPLQTGDWYEGINPSELKVVGDKIYGRGVADNKGQHFINLMALLSVLKTKKKLGFNLKLIFEMGEEIGSPGLFELCELYKDCLLYTSPSPRDCT